jgi:hypothetical protein
LIDEQLIVEVLIIMLFIVLTVSDDVKRVEKRLVTLPTAAGPV